MTERLKPCPFCGKEAFLAVEDAGGIEVSVDGEHERDVPTWAVYCGYCGACGPEAGGEKAEAAEAWNRRANEEEER